MRPSCSMFIQASRIRECDALRAGRTEWNRNRGSFMSRSEKPIGNLPRASRIGSCLSTVRVRKTKLRTRFGKSSPGDFRRCDKIRNRKMAFSHIAALEYLQRAHQQNRLAHAYLISGPPGSGKQLLAAELASLVNGTNANDVFSSKAREIFVAQPESRSRRIVISQIRELEHALHMRASNGRRKVAIISEADRLQPQAANAFLKTLEEPPKDSLLLLLSALPEALPDTILSRCIPIPLAPNEEHKNKLEEEELVKLLQQTARERRWTVQYAY